MEVLSRPSLPQRNLSLFDSRTLWWPGSGRSPTESVWIGRSNRSFGPQAPPSPPLEMSKKLSLPPISDLLAYSTQSQNSPGKKIVDGLSVSSFSSSNAITSDQRNEDTARRTISSGHNRAKSWASQPSPTSRFPPTPPSTSNQHSDQCMQPPLIMQPKHDIQRIDPALFNESKQRSSAGTSPVITRPTIDTSSYPPFPPSQSTTTPYTQSAPLLHSQYGELSPRTAVSAAAGPHYSASQQQTPQPMSAPVVPSSRRYSTDLPPPIHHHHTLSSGSDDPVRRPLLPQQSPHTGPSRSGFHPYDAGMHTRRPSHGSDPHQQQHGVPGSQSRPAQSFSGRAITGRNYTCASCMKEFSRPSSLKIHEHSHTGAKPFICPRGGCGKSFSVRSNMKRHERGCHMASGMGPMPEEGELD